VVSEATQRERIRIGVVFERIGDFEDRRFEDLCSSSAAAPGSGSGDLEIAAAGSKAKVASNAAAALRIVWRLVFMAGPHLRSASPPPPRGTR
jgi:hypothetical protein